MNNCGVIHIQKRVLGPLNDTWFTHEGVSRTDFGVGSRLQWISINKFNINSAAGVDLQLVNTHKQCQASRRHQVRQTHSVTTRPRDSPAAHVHTIASPAPLLCCTVSCRQNHWDRGVACPSPTTRMKQTPPSMGDVEG